MKYSVGDKIAIRNDLIFGEWYDGVTAAQGTVEFSGDVATITSIAFQRFYFINIDDGNCVWTDEMIDHEKTKRLFEHYNEEYNNVPNPTFKDICHELMTTYSMKNSDYGDSFGKTFEEYGLVSAVVRIADKYNRISQLAKSERKVDESIEDTLLDLAGYCIMTVMELRKDK